MKSEMKHTPMVPSRQAPLVSTVRVFAWKQPEAI